MFKLFFEIASAIGLIFLLDAFLNSFTDEDVEAIERGLTEALADQ